MLQCAQKCANTKLSASYLTAGEFSILASEVQRCFERGIILPVHLFQSSDKHDQSKEKIANMSKCLSQKQHQIFLGGSCNPTTWRQDEAIPLLKNLGITFYNPQVSHWRHELIEQEHEAKQNASVLFYVIDNRTRNVVGIIEAANFAGCSRKLVLVVNSYNGPGHNINGEPISDQEYLDLRKSLDLLKHLMQKQNIPTFETIPTAVTCAANILCNRDGTKCVTESNDITHAHQDTDVKLLAVFRETFNALDTHKCGSITLNDMCIAYRLLYREIVSINEIEKSICNKDVSGSLKINFEQFCSILRDRKPASGCKVFHDLYLTGLDSTWRQNVVEPLLRKHGLSYFIPEDDVEEDYFAALCSSRVLLFVVSEHSRALTTMTKAAFALGLGADAVLCIQSLRPDSKVNGCETLSEQAMNDYNRGRIYLMDLAKRDNIPFCSDLQEAVLLAISKVTTF